MQISKRPVKHNCICLLVKFIYLCLLDVQVQIVARPLVIKIDVMAAEALKAIQIYVQPSR